MRKVSTTNIYIYVYIYRHIYKYSQKLVDGILNQAASLTRDLRFRFNISVKSGVLIIRWVILSGTPYEKQINDFNSKRLIQY